MPPEKGSTLCPRLLSRRDIGRPRSMIDSSRASGTVVSCKRGVTFKGSGTSFTEFFLADVKLSSREPFLDDGILSSRELFLIVIGASSLEFFLAIILGPNFSEGSEIEVLRGAS